MPLPRSTFFLLVFFLFPSTTPVLATPPTPQRISVNSAGVQGNGDSSDGSFSADGRYAAFVSKASNLVAGDSNEASDIFVHDRQAGTTTVVSINSSGTLGNGASHSPAISETGRYVLFASYASNLVPRDTNNTNDVFVYDRQTGETSRVSVDSSGNQFIYGGRSPSISPDGRYVSFTSAIPTWVEGRLRNIEHIFMHDRQTGLTSLVSIASDGTLGNWNSFESAVSPDGRHVVFLSLADNLVENDSNTWIDIFLHDRQAKTTRRLNVTAEGNEAPYNESIPPKPSFSPDGRYIAFTTFDALASDDTNWLDDTYLHDLETGITVRASLNSKGEQPMPYSVTPKGVLPLPGPSPIFERPFVSEGGRFVAFVSGAINLVDNDTNGKDDMFIKDMETGAVTRIEFGNEPDITDKYLYQIRLNGLSANGTYVLFTSKSTDLVGGDTNDAYDVFLRGPYLTERPPRPRFIPAITGLLLLP